MEWIIFALIAGVFVFLIGISRLGSISPEAAKELLDQGAKIIDVRTPGEFSSGHLKNAINIPLGEIEQAISKHVPRKETILLLHCHSGGRSGIATRIVRKLGYGKAFNLGSFSRAEKIILGKN